MRKADDIKRYIKDTKIKTNPEVSRTVLNDLLGRMDDAEGASSPTQHFIGRRIMESKITKLAAAAVVAMAVFIGINMFNGTPAWAEIAQRLELSYHQYHEELELAMKDGDLQKASSKADSLSELWQGLHALAETNLDPSIQIASENSLVLIEYTLEHYCRDIDQDAFQNDADRFLHWFDQVEDETWIYDMIHISKELEEYAEGIRDAGRETELDNSYVEHCFKGFMTYSNWFEKLPWNEPVKPMAPATVLSAIERDLATAAREIGSAKREDANRTAKRCIQQALRNCRALEQKTKTVQLANQWRQVRQLSRKIDKLSDLVAYLTIKTSSLGHSSEPYEPVDAPLTWTTNSENNASFGDYFVGQVEQTLDLCNQLYEDLATVQ
jgi:hypothetical protein